MASETPLSTWSAARNLQIREDGSSFDLVEMRVPFLGIRRAPKLIARGDWQTVLLAAQQGSPLVRAATAVDLALSQKKCLKLDKAIPKSAIGKAREILTLELENSTPFLTTDIYADFFWHGRNEDIGDSVPFTMVIAKRSIVDPHAAELRARGLNLGSVTFLHDDGSAMPANVIRDTPIRSRTLIGHLNTCLRFCLVCLAVVCAANSGAHLWRQSTELAKLQAELEKRKFHALAARKKLDEANAAFSKISGLTARKFADVAVIQIWEHISRIVPDSAWLTNIKIEDGKLQIEGLARSASELISLFEHSNHFSKVEFGSPVTRDAQMSVERFQIRMNIGKSSSEGPAGTTPGNVVPPT